ncbi:MAG: hypothetical protein JJT75_07770 [Opitutales bacterium]|nr:hypothetical protein [Opitutales bacterium]MCH8539438.1 hypothetical protein [Opitutales bacterium]
MAVYLFLLFFLWVVGSARECGPWGGDHPNFALTKEGPGTFSASGTVNRNLRNNANVAALGGSPLTLSGVVSGAGNFAGDFTFAGTTRPGNSPGRIEVDGDLTYWIPTGVDLVEETPEQLVFRDNTPISSGTRRFLRIKFTLIP